MKLPCLIFCVLLAALFCNIYGQDWKMYSDSAKIFADQKLTDKAIDYYSKAREILRQDSLNTETYIQSCKNIAVIYFSLSNYGKAEPLLLEVKEKTEKLHGKDNAGYATNADLLGQLYYKANPQKAEVYFTEAKNIREKVFTRKSTQYAASCNSLGNLYSDIGENEKAETFYLEAKEIVEQLLGKDDPEYARNCNNLAAFYRTTGDYEKAEAMALEAKRIREKLIPVKQHPTYALTCTNLGNIYRDMGQFEKAEQFYIEAKGIREKLPPVKEHLQYASSCNILADLYVLMKEFTKAEALYLEAKQIREKQLTKNSNEYAVSCNNLASLYRDMGQFEKAESLALEAKAIWDKNLPTDHPNRPINNNNLGELYYAMGEYKKAEALFLEARQLWEKSLGKEHPYYFQSSAELARIYWNTNNTIKANELFSEAFISQYNQLNKVFRFTNEAEKQQYLKNINGSADEYQSFYYKAFGREKAAQPFTMSLLNRNLVLSSIQKTRQVIYNSSDTTLAKRYNEWTSLKQQLAKLYARGVASNTEQVQTLEEKAGNIEKELSRKSSAFKQLSKTISWKDIHQSLKEKEVAIEFIEFKLNDGKQWTDSILYMAVVLKKELTEPILVPLFEKKQLDKLLGQRSADIAKTINLHYSSASLFNLVWQPLEKYLAGVTKVYFAPAGNLFKLSFAALPVNDKEVLSDKYQLVQLNTTATVTDNAESFITRTDKIQLYGGIAYDADSAALKQAVSLYQADTRAMRSLPDDLTRGGVFQYLPGTMQEVEEIKKEADKVKTSITVFSGINASEESFKSLSGRYSPSVLHIATHGFFFPDIKNKKDSVKGKNLTSGNVFKQSDDPLFRAGLLFAGANTAWQGKFINGIEDGVVTAYEVANTMYLPNTKLVVLSACETALGDIQGSEGVFGLQRAFKMAGAQNLVMSLWKVPDAETSAFMQIFYNNMFSKQSVSDAFYNAQAAMKNKYRNDPYKWAAWVLIK